jgi:hypothetical protein
MEVVEARDLLAQRPGFKFPRLIVGLAVMSCAQLPLLLGSLRHDLPHALTLTALLVRRFKGGGERFVVICLQGTTDSCCVVFGGSKPTS